MRTWFTFTLWSLVTEWCRSSLKWISFGQFMSQWYAESDSQLRKWTQIHQSIKLYFFLFLKLKTDWEKSRLRISRLLLPIQFPQNAWTKEKKMLFARYIYSVHFHDAICSQFTILNSSRVFIFLLFTRIKRFFTINLIVKIARFMTTRYLPNIYFFFLHCSDAKLSVWVLKLFIVLEARLLDQLFLFGNLAKSMHKKKVLMRLNKGSLIPITQYLLRSEMNRCKCCNKSHVQKLKCFRTRAHSDKSIWVLVLNSTEKMISTKWANRLNCSSLLLHLLKFNLHFNLFTDDKTMDLKQSHYLKIDCKFAMKYICRLNSNSNTIKMAKFLKK